MYRPNYNRFLNDQPNFSHSRLYPQCYSTSRDYYTPRRYNNHQLSQAHGDNLGFQAHNNEYWCETCDRGFTTQILLDNHKKQHQKCNIDGCQYIAHPKVITKHIQMQHSSGLYKKIAKLNNPEEIEKWREERRKKYPTKSNIDKRNLELQEKIERGEKMGIRTSHSRDGHKQKNGFSNKYPRQEKKTFKRTFPLSTIRPIVPKKIVKFETNQEGRQLKPFTGIQQLIDDTINSEPSSPEISKDLIEDDEIVDDLKSLSGTKQVVCGALVSLLNDYGSSDEEADCPKTDQKEDHIETQVVEKCVVPSGDQHRAFDTKKMEKTDSGPEEVKVKECIVGGHSSNQLMQMDTKINLEDDDSGPDEEKVMKEVTTPNELNTTQTKAPLKSKNRHDKVKMADKSNNSFKRKLPSTLLEKLLSSEIRQERNIVLQCIRYIIRNNYFEINK